MIEIIGANRATLVGNTYLTFRQVETLRLLAQGKTNRQIAEEMGSKLNTTGEQLKTIYKKLGAHNRAMAGVLAAKAGLV